MTDWREKNTLRVEEAGEVLGLSRPSAYAAVRRGELPAIRIGKRLLIPVAGLRRMLGENEGAAAVGRDDAKDRGAGHDKDYTH